MGVGPLTDPVDQIFTEGINEVIVTTCNNAAPMGIIRKNDSLSMIVFRTSHTAQNIIRDGWLVAHISHDPILFVKTAFEDLSEESFIQELIGNRIIHRLRGIQNWICCNAHVEHTTSEKLFVRLEPIHVNITQVLPIPVHRGLNNIIEATVHATRFILNEDPELARFIRHHGELVLRCGGEQDKRAMRLLYEYVNTAVPGTFL
ncbi:MAG: hypothetical protein BWY45_01351 [Euryarchaeota archaeon ADurb.Bin294]|jgi:hypothetical protein|nr:MAG: hypothetical protein BWY45_01351 [Euryarchaeota archaeon ADurb.Bin294]